MVKKVIMNLDSSTMSGPDCIPAVGLKNCEPELHICYMNSEEILSSRLLGGLIGGPYI